MSSPDVSRLHFNDLEETRLGCGQVRIMVDADVTHLNEALDVVRMVLKHPITVVVQYLIS